MIQPSHPLYEDGCKGVIHSRVFNGDHAFTETHTLEAFEAAQQNDATICAPCPAGSGCWACPCPSAHSDSIMIAVDGACRGNGRWDATGACAVFFAPHSPHNETHVLKGWTPPTSQRAELMGGIKALEAALRLWKDSDDGYNQVVIKTDSAYLFRGATEWIAKWEGRGWTNAKGGQVANQDLFQDLEHAILDLEDVGVLVQFFQVPRWRNQQADAAAGKALDAPKRQTYREVSVPSVRAVFDVRPEIAVVSLDSQPFFDEMYSNLISSLSGQALVVRTSGLAAACSFLASNPPAAVLVADAGITDPRDRPFLDELKKYVSNGGTAVFCGLFSNFVQPNKLGAFFRSHFGLSWECGDYTRASFRLNQAAASALPSRTRLPGGYNVKALHLSGVARHAALFEPEDGGYQGQTVAAWEKVGKGWAGYVGDVNAEEPTDRVILSMCGL